MVHCVQCFLVYTVPMVRCVQYPGSIDLWPIANFCDFTNIVYVKSHLLHTHCKLHHYQQCYQSTNRTLQMKCSVCKQIKQVNFLEHARLIDSMAEHYKLQGIMNHDSGFIIGIADVFC